MNIQFATCVRKTALEYIADISPEREITDTPDCAGPLLDLVERDILRVQDPKMHKRNGQIQVITGKKWDDKYRDEAVAAGKTLGGAADARSTA